MGFFILPLLLLGLLATSLFDSGDTDDHPSGDDNSGDDTLSAAGTDTAFAGAGDDDLTLTEDATGLGGAGDDTIAASDTATGYGLDGDDSLTGHGSATLVGGDGDDRLFAFDDSAVWGGEGDDRFEVGDNAFANGGAGADWISLTIDSRLAVGDVLDAPSADGCGGADTVLASSGIDGGSVTVGGGAGGDTFVITDVNSKLDDNFANPNTSMTITDFDPAIDTIGIIADADRLGELDVFTNYDAAGDTTSVRVMDLNPANSTLAEFLLQGQQSFDASDLRVYTDSTLTAVDFSVEGSATADNLMSFGHPAGQSVMHGLAGDDIMMLQNGTAYGGTGDDAIAGRGTLYGDDGNDNLIVEDAVGLSQGHPTYLMRGQAHGGDGDDTITAIARADQGDYSQILADLRIEGGAGNDVITASRDYGIDAGSGDDIVSMVGGTGFATFGAVKLGTGADVLLTDTTGEYADSAEIADFNLAEDQIAVILPQATTVAPISIVWDAVSGNTVVELEGSSANTLFSFTLQGVNGEAAPPRVHFYESEAAFQANQPYRSR